MSRIALQITSNQKAVSQCPLIQQPPGDYLKYGSDAEAYGSLARNRRSLSASALGRELAREFMHYSFRHYCIHLVEQIRELDTLSRSPDRLTPRGYSSDTGYMNDTMRSRTRGYSNYDYDTYQASKSEVRSTTTGGAVVGNGGSGASASASARYQMSSPARVAASTSYGSHRGLHLFSCFPHLKEI
ncbi:unnamed protein product [Gongylonema pulchrum]|uniref:Plakophilin-3 n=1 Tax=Gongylonema pulchrum TaxID=637853 RepID=A0A183DY87_9BILA|nr:unnamed protein product [Gongylonema pulchrum]